MPKGGRQRLWRAGISPGYVETIAPISLTNLVRRADMILYRGICRLPRCSLSRLNSSRRLLGFGRTLEERFGRTRILTSKDMMPSFFNQSIALLPADAVKLKVDRYESDIEHIPLARRRHARGFREFGRERSGRRDRRPFTAYADDKPKIQIRLNWVGAKRSWCTGSSGRTIYPNSTLWPHHARGRSIVAPYLRAGGQLPLGSVADKDKRKFDRITPSLSRAMNVINAIPYVCEAPNPGIKHHGKPAR